MATIGDVIKVIEGFAAPNLQADFDNSGLKCGNPDTSVTGVMITLDTNECVVKEAIEKKCNLIIEHHPSIFKPLKKLDFTLPLIKAIGLALKHDIAIYSAHTNMDFCKGGLNDYAAQQCGLIDIKPIDDEASPRMGFLKQEITLRDYADKLKKLFNDEHVLTIGNLDKKIKKVAIVNGGGGSSDTDLLYAMNAGADVFITGDIKYSVARLAKDINYAIIQVGHYNTEQGFLPLTEKVLKEGMSELVIYKATSLLNPYN